MVLGWGFDGENCSQFSGCDCAPNCDAFHGTLQGCMDGCAGYCDESVFEGLALAQDDWGPGTYCDDVSVCVEPWAVATVLTFYPVSGTGTLYCALYP
jgi:hypothetical protein